MSETAWFYGQPTRSGMYRRRFKGVLWWSFWNNTTKKWSVLEMFYNTAWECRHQPSQHQGLPWMGLLEDPSA
jgi:hypothetical protein